MRSAKKKWHLLNQVTISYFVLPLNEQNYVKMTHTSTE